MLGWRPDVWNFQSGQWDQGIEIQWVRRRQMITCHQGQGLGHDLDTMGRKTTESVER